MSSYDNRKLYWLKLKEDFFDEDNIRYLEEQPNGKEYALFYLKLCLKSLKTSGILIKIIGDMLVPYDISKLAELTNTSPEIVRKALKILKKIQLVKVLNNGELYLSNLENMVGEGTIGALKKQQQRMLKKTTEISQRTNGGQLADNCPPDIELDIDKDIDIYKRECVREKKQHTTPTLEDIKKFASERNSIINPQKFYDFYSVNNWKDTNGKYIGSNWKQKFLTWENEDKQKIKLSKELTLTENEKEFYGGTRNGDF